MTSNFVAKDADAYEKLMGRFSRQLAKGFMAFTGVASGERIIDVGCGTGSLSFALAAQGDHAEIIGIDVSAPYVEYAQSKNTFPRTRFEVADATKLPFPAGVFDRAASQLVLMFLPDPSLALMEMRRVVRPGGQIAACAWDLYGGMPHMRMLWDAASALGIVRDASLFRPLNTEGEMGAMWRQAGLIDVVEDTITTRFEFADFDDYWTPFLSGDGPHGKMVVGLSEEQRAVLEKQVRHVFLSGRPDGRRSFIGAAWICKGQVPG